MILLIIFGILAVIWAIYVSKIEADIQELIANTKPYSIKDE